MTSIDTIRNLGPAAVEMFARAGITTAEDLYELGADAAYTKALAAGTKPHFIGYYVLHMALQGRPWNDCKGAEKAALRAQYDAIVARSFDKGLSDFERTLDEVGVLKPPHTTK